MAIGELAETRINSRESVVDWQINGFVSLSTGYHPSDFFNFSGERWRFKLFTRAERTAEVNLFLCKETGPPRTIVFTFGIRGLNGVEMEKGTVHVFQNGGSVYCLENFCFKSDLRNHRLMQDNKVIISCDIKTNGTPGVRDVCTQTFSPYEALTEEMESSEKRGGEKALEDFGKLLASGDKSDVTVQVSDVDFKVHSAILSARCPALSVSLHHESKEKASNRIVVEDCEPGAFRDFLHYIYTGSVKSLDKKDIFGLYRVADKYLADDLKFECLKLVGDTLCVQTFCDTVKLALTHGESGLLQHAMHFATDNIQSIICSVEWQNFICECPTQANEILIKCLGPRN